MKTQALPPFLMSSVPKSGTHMLHQILNGIPSVTMDIHNEKKKFFYDTIWQEPEFFQNLYEDHHQRLSELQENEFGLGHLFHTKKYAEILQAVQIKHIFLYRDPRDVLVSLAYFIGRNWPEHPLYSLFQSSEMTIQLKLLTLLYGTPKWPDFQTYMKGFYGWLGDKNTLHVRFEDLIRTEEDQRKTVLQIVQFLYSESSRPASLDDTVSQMISNINSGTSATFRSGKIGSWEKEFDEHIKAIFKVKAGDLLLLSGYEKDQSW